MYIYKTLIYSLKRYNILYPNKFSNLYQYLLSNNINKSQLFIIIKPILLIIKCAM